jgi:hypothetical protein
MKTTKFRLVEAKINKVDLAQASRASSDQLESLESL